MEGNKPLVLFVRCQRCAHIKEVYDLNRSQVFQPATLKKWAVSSICMQCGWQGMELYAGEDYRVQAEQGERHER